MYKSREVKVGPYILGTGHPVRVQSMCNTDTRDAAKTAAQICALEDAGCEINRVAVPDMQAAQAFVGKDGGVPEMVTFLDIVDGKQPAPAA